MRKEVKLKQHKAKQKQGARTKKKGGAKGGRAGKQR